MDPKGSCLYSYKREAERDSATDRRGQSDVKMEAEVGIMQPQADHCQEPQETGRDSSPKPQGERDLLTP